MIDSPIPRLSVIIPHLDDLTNLDACLGLLERQTVSRGDFEIIVADNGSRAGEAAVLAAIAGRASLVHAPIRGAGPARNAGAAAARGEILAFTDADCRPALDWLERGVAALASADVVGGRVIVEPRIAGQPTGAESYEMIFAFRTEDYVKRKRFVSSCSLFVRRADFDRVGDFRTQVSEDVDWSWRAQDAGLTIGYDSTIVIAHPARPDWFELTRKVDRVTRETWHLRRETAPPALRWFGYAWLVLASGVAYLPRVAVSPQPLRWRDRVAAAGVLVRLSCHRFVHMHRLALGLE